MLSLKENANHVLLSHTSKTVQYYTELTLLASVKDTDATVTSTHLMQGIKNKTASVFNSLLSFRPFLQQSNNDNCC